MTPMPVDRRVRGGRRAAGPRLPVGFGVLWITVAVDLLGFGIVVPLLPLYARRLGAGPEAVGMLLAAFSAAQLVAAPVLGRLSDRVGRKPVLVVSLVGTALGSLLTGLAGSLWVLFLARVLDGASGGSVPVAQAAAADLTPAAQRTRVFGLIGADYGVGFVVGPALGGLAALGGTRTPFLVAAGIASANAVVAVRRLPETRSSAAAPGSAPAAPKRRRGLWRAVAGPGLVTLLVVGAFSAFEATFPLLGHRRLGLGLAGTGAVFAMVGLVAAAVQAAVVHPLAARLGTRGALRVGIVLEAVGLGLLAGVHTRPGLVLPLALVTAGQGLCTPTLSALVAAGAGHTERGGAPGLQQGLSALARVVGPALGGLAYTAGAGVPFVAGAAVLGGALVFSLVSAGLPGGATPVVVEAPSAGYR